jgi:hypothetical protein
MRARLGFILALVAILSSEGFGASSTESVLKVTAYRETGSSWTEAKVREVLENVASYYSPGKIRFEIEIQKLGKVSPVDINYEKEFFETVSRQKPNFKDDRINIFFLKTLVVGGEKSPNLLGFNIAGIPGGARCIPVKCVTGVLIWDNPKLGDSFHTGAVLAHETGHFLGLYHTQGDSSQELGKLQAGPGLTSDNIMSSSFNFYMNPAFTENQFNIIRRHAVFR